MKKIRSWRLVTPSVPRGRECLRALALKIARAEGSPNNQRTKHPHMPVHTPTASSIRCCCTNTTLINTSICQVDTSRPVQHVRYVLDVGYKYGLDKCKYYCCMWYYIIKDIHHNIELGSAGSRWQIENREDDARIVWYGNVSYYICIIWYRTWVDRQLSVIDQGWWYQRHKRGGKSGKGEKRKT